MNDRSALVEELKLGEDNSDLRPCVRMLGTRIFSKILVVSTRTQLLWTLLSNCECKVDKVHTLHKPRH